MTQTTVNKPVDEVRIGRVKAIILRPRVFLDT